jgi:hypothetical protein
MNIRQTWHRFGKSLIESWKSHRDTYGVATLTAWIAGAALIAVAWSVPDARAQPDPLQTIQTQLNALQQGLAAANQKLDNLAGSSGMVPFAVQANGGLCDSAAATTSNPQILIEGTGSGLFVVTSVLIRTGPQGQGQEGYTYVTANNVTIDGTRFDTVTGNLFAPVSGWGVNESADLMGMPVRIAASPANLTASPRTASPPGGNFPHQIVADSSGASDIRIQLFCRADTYDLSISTVRVSGWRAVGDTVAVTYVPGH